MLPAALDVTVDVDPLTPDDTAAMENEEQVVGVAPKGQLGAVEVWQLSETPSSSRSTNKYSGESSQSSAREESMPADDDPESQQRSVED